MNDQKKNRRGHAHGDGVGRRGQAAAQLGAGPAYMATAPLALDLARETALWGRVIREQKSSPG